jgi:hypothetical protein
VSRPNVYYVDWLPFNYNGLATPFGILITKKNRGSQVLLRHEIHHYRQQQRGGLFFFIDYVMENITKGYDRNKYEVSARKEESDFCKTNYTHCVRNGLAKTAHNKHFRK